MTLPETVLFAGLASVLLVLGITLFRAAGDKEKSPLDDTDDTYKCPCRRMLEPALQPIIGANRGAFRARKFLGTPEVARDMESYNRALLDYNEADSRRGAALLALDLAFKASLAASVALYSIAAVCVADEAYGGLLLPPTLGAPAALQAGLLIAAFSGLLDACLLRRWRREESIFRREMRAIRRRLP